MDYSDNPKVVFVAIPKTGTRSVTEYIRTYLAAKRFKGTSTHTVKIPRALSHHYSFTVVRNPFDRLVSYWWSTCMRPQGFQLSFEQFLKREHPSLQSRTQSYFQYPYIVENKLDKIIRYETLNEEFQQLPFYKDRTTLQWLNPTTKVWKNIPPRPPTSELLTPKIKDIIRSDFAKDFEVCGYSMEYEE